MITRATGLGGAEGVAVGARVGEGDGDGDGDGVGVGVGAGVGVGDGQLGDGRTVSPDATLVGNADTEGDGAHAPTTRAKTRPSRRRKAAGVID